VLLLIDTRDRRPPPEPDGPRRRPSLRSLRPAVPFVEAGACLTMATMVPPVPSYVLVVAALALVGHGASRLMPDLGGLDDHRQ
jgi:hypothetical protein